MPLLLSRENFIPHPYETIREGVLPTVVEESIYQGWVRKFERNDGMLTERLFYQSGQYRVTSLYLRPEENREGGYPLILFNRGGRNQYGMINVLTINNLLAPLIDREYLILASQYRGVDGSEGEDEFGGREVEDITALAQVASELPEWDGRNIYMFGWSRGGMMTLLALKNGLKVNAIALGAPLIDLTLSTGEQQKREAWLQRVLPNYEQEGHAALEARSAPYWMNQLQQTPTLLMHGDADKDVSVIHSRQFSQKLKQQNTDCKLIEYEGGNHYLNRQRNEVMLEVDAWFTYYRQ